MVKNKMEEVGGVLIFCPSTNRVLLVKRNDGLDCPNMWALISGGINDDETPLRAIKREVVEELQFDSNKVFYRFLGVDTSLNNVFYYFQGIVYEEFTPVLNEENSDYGWFDKDSLPTPLYPKLDLKIADIWQVKK
jgi:8-oxo-dGTP pyrophosphatase MutT (NUDIX family)